MSQAPPCWRTPWSPGTTLACRIFGGGPTCPICRRVFLSALHNQPCFCSRTPRIRVGVRLWEATNCPACGLRIAPAFRSTTRSYWRFSTLSGVSSRLQGQIVALYTGKTTALAYLKKQGGTRSQTLNLVAQAILRLCEVHHIQLLPQFIPGKLYVLADSLSRKSQVLGSEWTLCSEAFHQLLRRWPVTIDLFATSLDHCLPVYFSPMVDPQSAGTDACSSRGTASRLMPSLPSA